MAIQAYEPSETPTATPRKPKQALAQQLTSPTIAQYPGTDFTLFPGGPGGLETPDANAKQASSNQQPAVTQANQMGQAPYFQASAPGQSGPVAQFPQGGAMGVAQGLLGQLTNSVNTSPQVTQGMQEKAKSRYLTMQQQAQNQIAQSAASRGVGGNFVQSQIAENQANAPLELTSIFREIEAQREQEGLQRLLAALSGAQGLAGLELQGELGRGNLDVSRQSVANQRDLGFGNLALGNRQQDLSEANSTWDRNNIIPFLSALLGPSFSWG